MSDTKTTTTSNLSTLVLCEDLTKLKNKAIENIKNSICFVNMEGRESCYYFLNKTTNVIIPFKCPKARILETHNNDTEIIRLIDNPIGCKVITDPSTKKKVISNKSDYPTINLYNSPQDYFIKKEVNEMPPLYNRFFKHLIPKESQREHFIDWFAYSLRARNQTYAVFVSGQGTGKGICADIVTSCHLQENIGLINDDALTGKFNQELEGKTFILFDEAKVEGIAQQNKLKSYINEYIRLEAKGKDGKLTKVYFNLMIHSNFDNCLSITEDERRLSIYDVTNVKFLDVFTIEDIASLKSEENITLLFNYLMNRNITFNVCERVVGDKAKEILNGSASEWERQAYEFIQSRGKGSKVRVCDIKTYLHDKCMTGFKTPSSDTIFTKFKAKYQKSIKATKSKGFSYLELLTNE